MLPDTVHLMSQIDKDLYALLLSSMAHADGLITPSEKANLESRLGMALLAEEEKPSPDALQNPEQITDGQLASAHPANLKLILRDAMLMAAVDEFYDPREIDLINRVAAVAGISEEQLMDLYSWVEEGWAWMNRGRSILGLPEEVANWESVYDE